MYLLGYSPLSWGSWPLPPLSLLWGKTGAEDVFLTIRLSHLGVRRWCCKGKLFLCSSMCVFLDYFFPPVVWWNFSAVLSDSHKGTLNMEVVKIDVWSGGGRGARWQLKIPIPPSCWCHCSMKVWENFKSIVYQLFSVVIVVNIASTCIALAPKESLEML